MSEWKSVKDELPPEGVVVVTMVDKGNEINNMTLLKRINNLWFFPGGEMYVYYTPTHWKFRSLI